MILEATILSLCVSNLECNIAPRAYFLSNKGLRTWVKQTQEDVKKYIKNSPYETPITVLTGGALLLATNRATIKINKNTVVRVRETEASIQFTWVF
jgi:hypothetical protein